MSGHGRYAGILPETWIDTLGLYLFAAWKIPLIAFVRPRIVSLDDERLAMKIPLRRRTKNHLGSMYFGALMIGADVAAGYYAAKLIWKSREKVDFVFKAADGRFLKRPTGDVHFICEQGALIRELVAKALATGERVDANLEVLAVVPTESLEPVARMNLVLSLKKRQK